MQTYLPQIDHSILHSAVISINHFDRDGMPDGPALTRLQGMQSGTDVQGRQLVAVLEADSTKGRGLERVLNILPFKYNY